MKYSDHNFEVACPGDSVRRHLGYVLTTMAVFTCLVLGPYFRAVIAQQGPAQPLTNAAVIKLVRAGFKEKTVIAIIRSRQSRFDLTPERLIELKRGGVSERIILTMIGQDDSDFVDDELGFEDMKSTRDQPSGKQGSRRDEGLDIFGSSGGSRNETSGRGGSGANEGNTVTTGSATVRIVRPPSESGQMPKLEKTPTLTNDSIIQMVEAGFSEGTIIRRIEQSPADFNLSSPQLVELQKHRVSAPVIAAMKAAMSDEPAAKSPASTNPEK